MRRASLRSLLSFCLGLRLQRSAGAPPLRSIGPVAHRLAAAVIVIAKVLLTGSRQRPESFPVLQILNHKSSTGKIGAAERPATKKSGAGGVRAVWLALVSTALMFGTLVVFA